MKIWVVTGESGEYSAWTCWVSSAFNSEEKAKAFADKCTVFEKEHAQIDWRNYAEREEHKKTSPDPYRQAYSDICEYKIQERELFL